MDQDVMTVQVARNSRVAAAAASPIPLSSRATVLAAPALLGLLLRGSLIDSEKENLDNLIPGNRLVFLVRDGVWIHPEGVPLFDFSEISGAVSLMGPAIVTHRYRSRHNSEVFSVCTGVLNPDSEKPVILGLFSAADSVHDDSSKTEFGCHVRELREILPRIERAARRLRDRLDTPEPALIVDQSSGTIMTANEAADSLFRQSGLSVPGMQYADLVGKTAFRSAYRLDAQRLDGDEQGMAVMTFQPVAITGRRPVEDSPARLIEDLNSALVEMSGALRSLRRRKNCSCDGVTVSLLHSLTRHAGALNEHLENLKQIVMGQPIHR